MKHTIKSLRALYQLTQAEMAIKVGVSLPTLIRWEQNGSKITLENQLKVAKVLKSDIYNIDWKL